jgi:hypothetical protein
MLQLLFKQAVVVVVVVVCHSEDQCTVLSRLSTAVLTVVEDLQLEPVQAVCYHTHMLEHVDGIQERLTYGGGGGAPPSAGAGAGGASPAAGAVSASVGCAASFSAASAFSSAAVYTPTK